jgi:putative hydrolase of the HAD superfamily
MNRVSAVVFDLDNVLYDERDYVCAAFRRISLFLSKRCRSSEDEVFHKLISDFDKKGSMYTRLFNDALNDFGLDQSLVPKILRLYATVDSKVTLFPEVASMLLELRNLGLKLALVTNGNIRIQRNKVHLLGIKQFFDVVVYARETPLAKDKPDPEVYNVALHELGVSAAETVCVGDNPHTDFWGAKQIGMKTVRVLCGEFKDDHLSEEYEAEVTLRNIVEFPRILRNLIDG